LSPLPHPQVILFIDEMHMLLGAGAGGAGTVDAANLLKPLLSRGKLRCIGATTLNEYKKHVEKGACVCHPPPPHPHPAFPLSSVPTPVPLHDPVLHCTIPQSPASRQYTLLRLYPLQLCRE
jgi:hypothetical protein